MTVSIQFPFLRFLVTVPPFAQSFSSFSRAPSGQVALGISIVRSELWPYTSRYHKACPILICCCVKTIFLLFRCCIYRVVLYYTGDYCVRLLELECLHTPTAGFHSFLSHSSTLYSSDAGSQDCQNIS